MYLKNFVSIQVIVISLVGLVNGRYSSAKKSFDNFLDVVYKENNCTDEPIEHRLKRVEYVFSGTIRDIRARDDRVESALVEIKRVFRGENRLNLLFLSEVQGRFLPVKHKVCTVEGFGNKNICFKHIREHDTWLFFTNARDGKLFLNSSLTRLSLVTIAQTEAAAKGKPYISPKTTYLQHKGECLHKPCPFGGRCQKNLISGQFDCRCISNCTRREEKQEEVCGSDGETYKDLCLLSQSVCIKQKNITALHKGRCKVKDPCENSTCLFGSKCVRRGSSYECTCVKDESCNDDDTNEIEDNNVNREDILCGSDGREYRNTCELKYRECLNQRKINISHRGTCDPCQSMQCYYGASCIIHDDKFASCACQHDCSQVVRKQCGSDEVTYDNLCFMNRAACLKQEDISLLHNGPCVLTCEDEECHHGSTCTDGKCTCPSECPLEEEIVCGTDGVTYINECALLLFSCNQGLPITVDHLGDCDEDVDSQGLCESLTCLYGGRCEVSLVDGEKTEECVCSFLCDDVRMPVCGSDKRIYFTECYLMRAACKKQSDIQPQPMEYCEGSYEEFCDGFPVMYDQSTGDELLCAGDVEDACPPEAYCHIIGSGGKCCEGYHVVSGCEMVQYGCCPDQVTAALGPDYFGCDIDDETACQCNPLGSLEPTCDPGERRCSCRPFVAGLRCDRCESNYWGFLRIADGASGCLACECNQYGSVRDDCDQMTGQCMCLENAIGIKCDFCSDGSPVTEKECSPDENNSASSTSKASKKTKRPKPSKGTKQPKLAGTKKTKPPKLPKTPKLQVNKTKHSNKTKIHKPTNVNTTTSSTEGIIALSTTSQTTGTMTSTTTTATTTTITTTTPLPTTTEDISSTDYRTPYFTGDSYVELKPLDHGSRDISIEIHFRSLSYNGLVFYAGRLNKKGDFISISIRNGSLEFRYDLGSGSTTLRIPSSIKLNELHKVTATRHGRDGLLKLDDILKDAGLSPGKLRSLDAGLPMYLGSVPDIVQQRNTSVKEGFHGCVEFLRIMSSELNYEYDLTKAISPDIVSDRKTYDCRESCTDYECISGGVCQTDKQTIFVCKCPERTYGLQCESEDDMVEDQQQNHVDLRKRRIF